MANWTTPKTWTADEIVTATDMNIHIRDNLNALKNPPTHAIERNNGAAYSTTSLTFVPVDATNLQLQLTTAGGDVWVHFHGTVWADSATARAFGFDIGIDGTTGYYNSQGYAGGCCTGAIQSTIGQAVSFDILLRGLAPGTHTFTLLWKAHAGTIYLAAQNNSAEWRQDVPAIFWAREV